MRTLALAAVMATAVGLTGCNADAEGSGTEIYEQHTLTADSSVIEHVQDPDQGVSDVTIIGSNNTITIRDGSLLHFFTLDGSNNLVTIESGVELDKLRVIGDDNTVEFHQSVSFERQITGSGNSVTSYSN